MSSETYWLPPWWNWIDNWDRCRTCLAYNGTPCASCAIPPGLLAMAQLVGGGTATVAGNLRGNATIASARQARAATRQHGTGRVSEQLHRQQRQLNVDVNRDSITRNRQ